MITPDPEDTRAIRGVLNGLAIAVLIWAVIAAVTAVIVWSQP